jgi:hypothetical protein
MTASIKHFGLTTAAALVFIPGAIAAKAAESTAVAAPITVTLVTLETSAYDAWKSKDAKFWGTFLSDRFIGWGPTGRLDKAAAIKHYGGADCEIKSYVLSDDQMRPLGHEAALFTHKITVDGSCGGRKIPASSWAAGVYIRDGGKWKAAFHAEAAIVDPGAAGVDPVGTHETRQENPANPGDGDASRRRHAGG